MSRLRQWSALALLVFATVLLAAVPGQALPLQKEDKDAAKPEEKWLVDRAMTVKATAAPVPSRIDWRWPAARSSLLPSWWPRRWSTRWSS